jgi:hypothetical protein
VHGIHEAELAEWLRRYHSVHDDYFRKARLRATDDSYRRKPPRR